MVLLRAGGLQSLQTMTLVAALPFGLIMVLLAFCLFKALRADRLYHRTKIPYGSRNWDGSHWRERLEQILTFSQKSDVKRFIEEKVRPAFEELQSAFQEKGIKTQIETGKRGPLSIELLIPHNQIWSFVYGVNAEKQTLNDSLLEEENTPDIDTNKHYVPVTYFSDGRSGNDIQYLSRKEIIADVLREYERYLSLVAYEDEVLLYINKKHRSFFK